VALQPVDGLLLITDGVTECFDRTGAAFGEERLMAELNGGEAIPLPDLLHNLLASLDRHLDGLPASDDVTALAVRLRRPR
jgi:sigma-B regulation protein RsbU (phosphoserine phosphatase)